MYECIARCTIYVLDNDWFRDKRPPRRRFQPDEIGPATGGLTDDFANESLRALDSENGRLEKKLTTSRITFIVVLRGSVIREFLLRFSRRSRFCRPLKFQSSHHGHLGITLPSRRIIMHNILW